MTQCDKMCELDRPQEGDREWTSEAYAEAEPPDAVRRKRNVPGRDAKEYVAELSCNGVVRGWITELPPAGFWVHLAWNQDQPAWINPPQTQPKGTKGLWKALKLFL